MGARYARQHFAEKVLLKAFLFGELMMPWIFTFCTDGNIDGSICKISIRSMSDLFFMDVIVQFLPKNQAN